MRQKDFEAIARIVAEEYRWATSQELEGVLHLGYSLRDDLHNVNPNLNPDRFDHIIGASLPLAKGGAEWMPGWHGWKNRGQSDIPSTGVAYVVQLAPGSTPKTLWRNEDGWALAEGEPTCHADQVWSLSMRWRNLS